MKRANKNNMYLEVQCKNRKYISYRARVQETTTFEIGVFWGLNLSLDQKS